ncbi:MAG: cytochrome C [Pseudomonadota bacterium]|nr:cytochrome C [Pseudomonadota bacterium]
MGLALAIASFFVLALGSQPAQAVPSFARQTGQPCAACHTAFPELTPFGRRFKLSGYTLGGGDDKIPPLAAMLMPGFTHTRAAQDAPPAPGLRTNDNLAIQQVTGFYAGKVYGDLGAFIQVSLNPVTQQLWFDASDVRYVKNVNLFGKDGYIGVTVNNTPTVQDVWNTVDAWAFPEIGSSFAANSVPGTHIDALAQVAGGAGMYLWWNDMLYAEMTAYRGYDRGIQEAFGMQPGPSPDAQIGTIPYWRVALEPHWGNHYVMVGTYGLYGQTVPGGAFGTGTDKYLDLGVDAQYQYDGDKYSVTVKAANTYEKQRLDSSFAQGISANPTDWINSFKTSASFVWDHTYSLTGGYFNVQGSSDAGLSANGVWGGNSVNNSPNGDGLIFDLAYLPFSKGAPGPDKQMNVRLGVEYVKYLHLFGGTNNFDGAIGTPGAGGTHNANGNDTLFLYAWAAF